MIDPCYLDESEVSANLSIVRQFDVDDGFNHMLSDGQMTGEKMWKIIKHFYLSPLQTWRQATSRACLRSTKLNDELVERGAEAVEVVVCNYVFSIISDDEIERALRAE